VHRLAWALANGPIPVGIDVLHHCDVRHCFELKHLYLGTQQDNNRDRDERHRMPTGDNHWTHRYPEKHGSLGKGTAVRVACIECGTIVIRKPSALRKHPISRCSKRCVAIYVNRIRWSLNQPDNTKPA
jgi:endogenous inhibitor of DNA gyrase (YacG/DUF329 family)